MGAIASAVLAGTELRVDSMVPCCDCGSEVVALFYVTVSVMNTKVPGPYPCIPLLVTENGTNKTVVPWYPIFGGRKGREQDPPTVSRCRMFP